MEKVVKQIIIVRKDLDLSCGKMGAQVAHASLAPILEKMRGGVPYEMVVPNDMDYRLFIDLRNGDPMKDWLEGIFRKVVLKVDSEQELLKMYEKIKNAGFTVSLIRDSAFTELEKPEYTCIGVEPLYAEQIDPLTKRLRLYK